MSAGEVAQALGGPEDSSGWETRSRAHDALIRLQSRDVAKDELDCGDAKLVAKISPQITLITKCGPNPLMSKQIFLDEHGVLRSDGSQCLMVQGTAARALAATAGDLARIISGCGSDSA
jgi:hypothetical protein